MEEIHSSMKQKKNGANIIETISIDLFEEKKQFLCQIVIYNRKEVYNCAFCAATAVCILIVACEP